MKVTELRINNKVLYNGSVVTIDIIISDNFCTVITDNDNFVSTHCDLLEPIPLTEEWHDKLSRPDDLNLGWVYTGNSLKVFHKGIVIAILRTVHQYQNFYFALTGEELEVDL